MDRPPSALSHSPLPGSLAVRIALGTVFFALALTAIAVFMTQLEFGKRLEAAERHGLTSSVHTLSGHLSSGFLERLRRDARIGAGISAAATIAEAHAAAQARQVAAEHFASILRTDPNYSRISLVSLRQPGEVLLRLDRLNDRGAIETATHKVGAGGTADNLSETTLFRIGRNLTPAQTYLSSIGLRRRDGAIIDPPRPEMQAVAPVVNPAGHPVALIVLELDLRGVFEKLQADLPADQSLYLFNDEGYCLTAPRTTPCSYGFEFPGQAADPELPYLFPLLSRELGRHDREAFSLRDTEQGSRDVITGTVLLAFDAKQTARRLTVVVSAPYASATAGSEAARHALAPLLVMVALVASLLAAMAISRLIGPLKRMADSVRAFAEEDRDLPLPTRDPTEIGTLARAFEKMREQVRTRTRQTAENHAREALVAAKEAAELDAKKANAIAALLKLSLERTALVDYLRASLDVLLDSVPWLALLPKGAIFLEKVGAGGTAGELRLAAERNLSPELIELCARVPHGKCLCGQAATREIQFATCLDERHAISFTGIQPHGHYNLPILHGSTLLGVLVLYLPHGYRERGDERAFLAQVADVLASGIAARQAHAELVDARIRAEAGERAKTEFLATMSHETRTPLNGILGMAHILEQTPLDAEQGEFVRTIQQSGQSLLAILNDILDLANVETGLLGIKPVEFDLARCLDDVAAAIKPRAQEKGLELLASRSAHCPRHFVGDPARFRQVLLNLLGNAVKFTEKGNIELIVDCIDTESSAAILHIAVRDTGIGIPPEDQESIFASFSQGDTGHARRFGGIGLGLALSKRLVELMGGSIGVDSTPGAGSTFWFTLPLSGQNPAHEAVPADTGIVRLDPKPLDVLRSQFGDDYGLLVDTFIETTPAVLAALRAACETGDAAATQRHAYDLGSSAATYGAMHLAALALTLKSDAGTGIPEDAARTIAAMQEEFEAVAAELAVSRSS
jgi:signal transduction histidine kinase/HAMP domain-containing protein/HPt (histidine-containing phosphotransfer) domain-containing protein